MTDLTDLRALAERLNAVQAGIGAVVLADTDKVVPIAVATLREAAAALREAATTIDTLTTDLGEEQLAHRATEAGLTALRAENEGFAVQLNNEIVKVDTLRAENERLTAERDHARAAVRALEHIKHENARLTEIERAARALADFAYSFKAYPQGLAGNDPLRGVRGEDITTIRDLANGTLAALNTTATPAEQHRDRGMSFTHYQGDGCAQSGSSEPS